MKNRHGETPKETLAFYAYAAGAWVSRRIPYRWGWAVARIGGGAHHRMASKTRDRVRRNLAKVLDEPPSSPLVADATRDAFVRYARYWFETFALRDMSHEEVLRRLKVTGREHVDRALEAGRGMIMALPHVGNWDVGGKWITSEGVRMTAVAERLKPERMFRLFLEHRQALGMEILAVSEDQRVGEALIRVLGENQMLCLVADRNISGRGVEVPMFGGTANLPAGPALLSLLTGAPLLPSAVYITDDGWDLLMGPPITVERTESLRDDVRRLTLKLGAEFERTIAAAPTDWHMFQEFWEPDGSSRPTPAAAEPATPAEPSEPSEPVEPVAR